MISIQESLAIPEWRTKGVEMMNKIIVLLATSFALSACGTVPTAVDSATENSRADAIDATEAQVSADDSGLGTIAYDGNTRTQPCKKRRRTGSHLYTVGCSGVESGSRLVQNGTWNNLGRYVVTGGGPN
jgi:hypothetical protein